MSVQDSIHRFESDETAEPRGRFPIDPNPIWRGTISQLGSHSSIELAQETAETELRGIARARLACMIPQDSPPPPSIPRKFRKIKKIKKFLENKRKDKDLEDTSKELEDNVVEPSQITSPATPGLDLVPLDSSLSQAGLRIIQPKHPDQRLQRVATNQGMPPESTPLGYLLSMLRTEAPESVNGAAILMWEGLRQKAAIALLPYMHPRIATVEADEDGGDHESALDALE